MPVALAGYLATRQSLVVVVAAAARVATVTLVVELNGAIAEVSTMPVGAEAGYWPVGRPAIHVAD